MTQPTLKIGLWNARGLTRGSEELRIFLSDHDIDVMLTTETHMRVGQRIYLPGYLMYHAHHPSGNSRGGSAVIIKSRLCHSPLTPISTNDRQIARVHLQTSVGTVTVAAVYLPPAERWIVDDFKSMFAALGNKFIAGGDYNAKHAWWGNPRSCPRGKMLQEVIAHGQYQVLATGEPTFYSYNPLLTPSALDFFITCGYGMGRLDVQTLQELSSDHLPILAVLHATPLKKPQRVRLLAHNADINIFKTHLEQLSEVNMQILEAVDIDNATSLFMSKLSEAAQLAAPRNRHEVEAFRPLQLPSSILALLRLKRRVRKEYARTGDPRMQQIHSRLANCLHKALARRKQAQIDTFLDNLGADASTNYSLWRITKRFKAQPTPKSAIKNPSGGWCRTSLEKTEVFANNLEQRFTPYNYAPESLCRQVEEYLESPFQMSLPLSAVTLEEVKNLIAKLPLKKAPGEDLLDNRTIRLLPDQALQFLALIFNSVLDVGYFPKAWKSASIIMIHKTGKTPTDVDSYRPTSLLPSLGKIMERLILNRLLTCKDVTKAIPKFQFGFRLQHGTPEQLHRVVNFALEAMENKEYAVGAFLDIQQAFDRVWHPGLLYKAKRLFPPQLYLVVKSFLEERTFHVSVDGYKSSIKPIAAGVPQGSVLGPTLYSVFASDMPTHTPVTEVDEEDVLIATYADDTAVLTKSKSILAATSGLQEYLDAFQQWAENWNVRINAEKCANVTFANRTGSCPGVSLNGRLIRHHQAYKYLGITLDRKLTFSRHITNIQQAFRTKVARMSWLIAPRNKLSLGCKVNIYKSILAPCLFYGLQVYGIAAKSHLNKIRILQAKTLRRISGAPWYMRTRDIERDLKVPKLGDKLQNIAQKYMERLNVHPNSLARKLGTAAVVNADPRTRVKRRLKRHHPHDLPNLVLT
uniref:RNA-directed DNA polymerase from mobile element jockey n=1 Tax=Drosophila melanogaster TaxID=7227 RepID=RTJK_DROME|nr:RecName: Full=RNA-directed DNA polymerase from mobile element jockey; AltName: Full=Reverse transcriptase [Drosophila melanogaster]AAA28675.1 ORF2, reverse transcriptase (put.); putative [Drosophila melanogaster]